MRPHSRRVSEEDAAEDETTTAATEKDHRGVLWRKHERAREFRKDF